MIKNSLQKEEFMWVEDSRERVPNGGEAWQYAPGVEIREIASSAVTTNQKKWIEEGQG